MAEREDIRKAQAEAKRRYRATHTTYCLNYSNAAAKLLETEARKCGLSVPSYLKEIIQAHQNGTGYIVPPDAKLHELVRQLRAIGTNINQLVRHIHESQSVDYDHIEYLQRKLAAIETLVETALAKPPSIEAVLAEHLTAHPEDKEKLLMCLKDDPQDD